MIMTSKILISLFRAFITSVVCGFMCCALLVALFQISTTETFFFLMVAGIFFNALVSGAICVLILLPLAVIEKNRMENSSFAELIRRYLPLIAFPLSIPFCLSFFADASDYEDYYFLRTYTINVLCMGYACLWVFLKRLKS